jgi:preprotein translocase subunit SecE
MVGMANEAAEIVESPWRRALFSAELYKRSQGKVTRQATFGALALATALGCWSLNGQLTFAGLEQSTRYAIVGGVLLAGWWLSFRLVNMPRFADFLISVEAEMSKVSWPTRSDLVKTSIVVMVTIFGMALVLYVYDFIWRFVLTAIGVLPEIKTPEIP